LKMCVTLGGFPARIGDVFQMWRVLEFVSGVGIGESMDHALAVEQSAEDLRFITRERIESFGRPFWSDVLEVTRNENGSSVDPLLIRFVRIDNGYDGMTKTLIWPFLWRTLKVA